MTKIIKVLIGLAALMSSVVPESQAEAIAKVGNQVSWAEKGAAFGRKVRALLDKAGKVMQDNLLAMAKEIAGQPSAEDFLTGYASAFDKEVGKVRKSEAKAIFSAWASNHQYEQVDTSTPELLKLAQQGTPVKISRSTQEWLRAHTGGYHALVSLARDLAPRVTDASATTGKTRVKPLSDKGFKKLDKMLASATSKQTDDVVNKAIAMTSNVQGFEHKLCSHIVSLCNSIKSKSSNPAMIEMASSILDVVAEATVLKKVARTAVTASTPAPAAAEAVTESVEVPLQEKVA